MINLILDTNIWINFVAKNNPPYLLENLIKETEKNSVNLLTNDIIIKEWERNKDKTIEDAKKLIIDSCNSIKIFKSNLSQDDEKELTQAIQIILDKEKLLITKAIERVERTEVFLKSCTKTPITNEMKLTASDWGIERRAPFQDKGSVGDALILISSAEYCKKNSVGFKDSIFVSFNHKDYTDGINKDSIHPDLLHILEDSNMIFIRQINKALHVIPTIVEELWKYINQMIDEHNEWEAEIIRGK